MTDESAIISSRYLLEKCELALAMFAEASAVLSEKGLSTRRDTVMDATLIVATNSSKTEDKSMIRK